MILITGANGYLGGATIDFLLKKMKPSQIAGMVRDPRKAENLRAKGIVVRQGDYYDRASMKKAFAGVKTLALISSGSIEGRTKQHTDAIDAAKKAGAQHLIYTSVLNPSPTPYFTPIIDHYETEEYLKASGVAYTILRNAWYMDIIPMFIGDALQSGKIFLAAGNGKAGFASRIDMAEALANVLASEGHEGKTYDIAPNTAYGFKDIATALSEALGKPIEYVDIPTEAMKEGMKKGGLDAATIEMTVSVVESIKHNELNVPSYDLEKLLGRKPASLVEFFRSAFAQKN
ncbi:SDR family oxidoreductase [candidate division KSB1 bacterium]|nr:SDR family oxidoreductase [candidate division KSB1 bacterium]